MTLTLGLPTVTYPDRLATFEGFWDDHQATARQLAAIGHVYDRPPLEALEEGSRCVSCSAFVRREDSIRALEGSLTLSSDYDRGFGSFNFHHPNCDRLQIRIPLDPQAPFFGLHGGHPISSLRSKFERLSTTTRESVTSLRERRQTSSLFSLPTELRLEIYSRILPSLDSTTEIVPLNSDSPRVVTKTGRDKTGPRDLTKTNILRTCKAIHNEALSILYHNITYRFISPKCLYLFLRQIGDHGRNLLSSIDIDCGSREDAITFSLLATCPKLKAITIRLYRPKILYPRAPMWCTDGMAALLTLSGMEEVKFADGGSVSRRCMNDSKAGAAVIRRELTRRRDTPGTVSFTSVQANRHKATRIPQQLPTTHR